MNKQKITDKNKEQFSKYLSYILRHNPGQLGLVLGRDGYVSTEKLIDAMNNSSVCKYTVELLDLKKIVESDEKQRYSFLGDADSSYLYIRANQGHSVKDVKMNYQVVKPPSVLYHGTSVENSELILDSCEIKPMSRQFVHLSQNIDTAIKVGKRHGKPVVFKIDTEKAYNDGVKFYLTENNIYLVESISTKYLEIVQK